MRAQALVGTAFLFGPLLVLGAAADAQTRVISESECQSLRQRLAEHARLSDGVRRALAAQASAVPASPPAATPSAAPPSSRAEAIRARLEQIPKERQALEDQRLAAVVKFDLGRATQIQGQIQTLDAEKTQLERELVALPPGPVAPSPPTPQPVAPDVARVRCQDVPTAVENAVKIRQRELGAREGQAGVLPLVGLKAQTEEQIARELAAQFAPSAAAATQVGLLDTDGDGRLDGFVDVPAAGVFRLARQRADGTVGLEAFTVPGSAPAYGELARRLEENTARPSGQALADMLSIRPAGPMRILAQTGEFGQAYARLLAGNIADAARIDGAAARSAEYQNLRGESVRVIEITSPVTGGVALRRLIILARPNDQELWEETTTVMRPVSYWRTDVELVRYRETRTTTGVLVGTRSTSAPVKFSVER